MEGSLEKVSPLTTTGTKCFSFFITIAGEKEEFLDPRTPPIVVCIRVANMSMTTRIEGLDGEVAELAKMLVGESE